MRGGWLAGAAVAVAASLAAAAAADASDGVYVANSGNSKIAQYTIGAGGSLNAESVGPAAAYDNPFSIAISPNGLYAYAANYAGATDAVSQYTIAANGALDADSPAEVDAEADADAVAVSPNGQNVYVVDAQPSGTVPGEVSQYTIGAGGTLTSDSPADVSSGPNASDHGPIAIAVAPSGQYVYVTDEAGPGVTEYTVNANGTLTYSQTITSGDLAHPEGIALSPNGQYAYVVNFNGWVSQYTVGANGTLNADSPATIDTSAAGDPTAIAISPGGEYVYVTNGGSSGTNGVSEYTVGSGGLLSDNAAGATAGSGAGPSGIAESPDGQYVYVANVSSNTISGYTVNPSNGALTLDAIPVATSLDDPEALVVAPDAGPTAAFTATAAQAGNATSFASQATDADEAITTQTWSFGDGTTATGAIVSHTYATPGSYTVTLTVDDAAGCSNSFPLVAGEAGPFIGQTSYCSPDAAASTSQTIVIPGPGAPSIASVTIKAPTITSGIACSGEAIQGCSGTLTLTTVEHLTGQKITAFSAGKKPHKPKKTTRTITLGSASYTLTGGGSTTLTITLGTAGKKLLAAHHKLPAMLSVTASGGTSALATKAITIVQPKPKHKKHHHS